MKTIVFIPARVAATRFPNKLLTQVQLPGNKRSSVLRCVYNRAIEAQHSFRHFDEDGMELYVVTSDVAIVNEVHSWGGQCIYIDEAELSIEHSIRNGTERCFYALQQMGQEHNPKLRIINVQGDEYIHPDMLLQLVRIYPRCTLATLVTPYTVSSSHIVVNDVKAVLARNEMILYFSRTNLPHNRKPESRLQTHLHLGVYMYSTADLCAYVGWDPTPGELTEGLEQLRFLECGKVMAAGVTTLPSVSVNVPRDIELLQQALQGNS